MLGAHADKPLNSRKLLAGDTGRRRFDGRLVRALADNVMMKVRRTVKA
jgi:hypothetical protein